MINYYDNINNNTICNNNIVGNNDNIVNIPKNCINVITNLTIENKKFVDISGLSISKNNVNFE